MTARAPTASSTVSTPTTTMFDWWIQPSSPVVSHEKRCCIRSKPSRVSASAIVTATYSGPATMPHASSARVGSVCFAIAVSFVRSTQRGLEELDDVAGGVLEQDLLAAGSLQDVVAEPGARVAQARDFGVDVVDDQVDAVPAAGARLGAVRHRPSRGAGRSAEQQPQVSACDVGEGGHEAGQDFEAEELRVEG